MLRCCSKVLVYTSSIVLFWSIAAPSAFAYIDPGSSSFIVQILIGAAAGGALAIATFWRRIKAFFSRLFGRGGDTGGAPPASSAEPTAREDGA
jgi:hypothetical protein